MRPSESDLDRCTLNIGPPINTLLTLHSGGKQFEVHNVFNSKYSKYHNGMPIDAIPRLSHCLEKLIQFQVKVVSQFIRSSWFDFSCVVRTMIWNDHEMTKCLLLQKLHTIVDVNLKWFGLGLFVFFGKLIFYPLWSKFWRFRVYSATLKIVLNMSFFQ